MLKKYTCLHYYQRFTEKGWGEHPIEERLGSAIFSRKPDIGAVLRLVLSCFPGDARLVQLYYDDQRLSILGETDKASEIPAALLDISHKLPGNGGIVYERGKAYFSWEIPLEVK